MRVEDLIKKGMSEANRHNYLDGLLPDTVSSLNGKYWRKLTIAEKRTYLTKTKVVLEDDLESDNHLGDANFQNEVIGSVPQFINFTKTLMSKYYLEIDRHEKKEECIFRFPEELIEQIDQSKSAYNYALLVQNTSRYQDNPKIEKSRSRRYKHEAIANDNSK